MGVIEEKLKLLPSDPGVYVMLGKDGEIIYVGKAKNLKNRVRQYFHASVKTEKVMAMVKNITDFYYYITPSEIDALSLENNLIKKHKPRYNILLKDDKTYPYIRVNLKEDFPTFTITRKIKKDGAKYFGPYMGGISVSSVLETLNLAYKIRLCDKKLSQTKPIKPCLNYHLKLCDAPCANLISKEDYRAQVEKAIDFLSGEIKETEKLLESKMLLCAEKEEFELAQKYKEKLLGLSKIGLKRITSLNKFLDSEVISYATNGLYSAVNVLVVRKGRMLGGKNYSFDDCALSPADALSDFIMQYYSDGLDIPDEIIVSEPLLDEQLLTEYFKEKFDKTVLFVNAKQGVRKQLLDMASVNAEEHLSVAVDKIKHKNDMTIDACGKLKEKLSLKNFPKRMECYDISNVSGTDSVGSMVVFINGVAERTEYRRFKIKTVEGANDYKSHQEMMKRRLDKLLDGDEKFSKPDLMIIDGGKGQLSSVLEIFREKGIEDIDLIALAEREEEIFLVGKSEPVVLEKRDYCLKMLQRIRDEAHRFAINYHRELRGKRALSSVLDGVKGLGKVKKKALLDKFKDLAGIIKASEEELMEVEGIGKVQAKLIIEALLKEGLR